MKKSILWSIIFLASIGINPHDLTSNPIDTIYVTPAELEPGWGLYWTDIFTQDNMPSAKSWVADIKVTPDGKYLAFRDHFGLKVWNFETDEITLVDKYGFAPRWAVDNEILIFSNVNIPGGYVWFPKTKRYDTLCLSTDKNCTLGASLGPDNKLYFAYPNGFPPPDSLIFRTNIYETLNAGHTVWELLEGIKWEMQAYPTFSPYSMEYNIRKIWDSPNEFYGVVGFHVVTGFEYKGRRTYYYPKKDTTWLFNLTNTYGGGSEDITLGPNGDVYSYLSFRSIGEFNNRHNPPFDSAAIAARDACGWYRVDTSGTNLVQLVRSWTYNLGGLSITGDGETIYYGYLLPDTCAAIMKMNKYGKNKEIVLRLPPFASPDAVENDPEFNEKIFLKCESGVVSNQLRLAYSLGSWDYGEISICDYFGRQVYSSRVDANSGRKQISLDTDNFSAGLYFIYLKTKDGFAIDKFVIVK